MDTLKFKKRHTLVVAHRGLSGIEPENTCAAFVAAGNRSYYGIETDIHRTADGQFAVVHDADLSRVAGIELSVEENDLSSLQQVVLYDKQGKVGRKDLRVCGLLDYLEICKTYEKQSVIELKSEFTPMEIEKICETVRELNYLNRTTFISFSYENLRKIRAVLPQQSVQFLTKKLDEDMVARLVADRIDLDVRAKVLTKAWVKELHRKGIKINCWTVDDPKTAEKLSAWGVDFITTNILE